LDIYQTLIRPLLFSGLKTDPEWLHQQVMEMTLWVDSQRDSLPVRTFLHQLYQSCSFFHPSLEQNLWGINFAHPVGLAPGFDKDGIGARIWHNLGFSFAELGTITYHPQSGNPQPRLFRLLEDQAVLNRMGFNNQGAATIVERLQIKDYPIPIGINLGKSKITPLEKAADDYLASFRLLKDLGDYFVVNVSSPNTPGLRNLQSAEQLSLILDSLQRENIEQKPLFVKIAPDLEWEAIADIISLAQTYKLSGIIATNTTINKEGLKTQILKETGNLITEEAGGISGKPVQQRSTEIIRFIYQQTGGKLPIIGVGGIFTVEDAWQKITAGASLLQVYTGWIYEGPWMIKKINQGLVKKLESKGLTNISQAIGKEP
jgi:dihydroorotate dehydrogenase